LARLRLLVDKRIAPDFSRLRSDRARFIFSAHLFSAYISATEFMMQDLWSR
jgi:hypothetical protein